jgi:fatty acid desaturase
MQFQQRNGAIAATWILAAGLVGLVGNVTSIGGVALILGFGLVPPILMMLPWITAVPEHVLPDTADSRPPRQGPASSRGR